MFIVWGKKRVESTIGFVTDFCPICRDIRGFQLNRVGLASHIYYISFGEGKLVGHILCCSECGVILSTDPTRYARPQKDSGNGLEGLIRDTFPNVYEVYAARLELEKQVRRSRSALPGEEYKRFLMEPFALLNPQVEERFAKSTEMDKQSSFGCLGTILIAS